MMQRLPYHRVPVIRPFSTILYTFFTTKFRGTDTVWLSLIPMTIHPLQTLKVQTRKEMDKVNKRWASKTCSLDAIPTALLKNSSIFPIVLPIITDLMNASVSTGIFPDKLKRAYVTPRLKKTGLDTNIFRDSIPVLNTPFSTKVIEPVVAQQLKNHLP